ncbi:acyl-CoA dehydrogenase family protein [Mycolicibacterium gilvum]|uniref:acyl-CoA dehydrogenase family protein n=1 Tax=Mycolicibacterium gilvum TaxID=1804 RepID=UPI00296E7F99
MQRHGRAPVPLLAAFDYLVGQADIALCCPPELAHGTVTVLERFATVEQRDELLSAIVPTGQWRLTGEKWFASNVGADLIVTLARVNPDVPGTKGLAMFLVPRIRHDGTPNGVSIRRLKDKMGTIGTGRRRYQNYPNSRRG